jgi:hypothetical protein
MGLFSLPPLPDLLGSQGFFEINNAKTARSGTQSAETATDPIPFLDHAIP